MAINKYDTQLAATYRDAPQINLIPENMDQLMRVGEVMRAERDKINEKIDKFYAEQGNWLSPIAADSKAHYEETVGKLKPIADAISGNLDAINSPEGRAMINNAIRNVDYGKLAELEANKVNALQYMQNVQNLVKEGRYDPAIHDLRLEEYAVGSGKKLNPNPIPYFTMRELSDQYFNDLKTNDVLSEDGQWIVSEVDRPQIEAARREAKDALISDPRFIANAEGQLIRSGWDRSKIRDAEGKLTEEAQAAMSDYLDQELISAGNERIQSKMTANPFALNKEKANASGRSGTLAQQIAALDASLAAGDITPDVYDAYRRNLTTKAIQERDKRADAIVSGTYKGEEAEVPLLADMFEGVTDEEGAKAWDAFRNVLSAEDYKILSDADARAQNPTFTYKYLFDAIKKSKADDEQKNTALQLLAGVVERVATNSIRKEIGLESSGEDPIRDITNNTSAELTTGAFENLYGNNKKTVKVNGKATTELYEVGAASTRVKIRTPQGQVTNKNNWSAVWVANNGKTKTWSEEEQSLLKSKKSLTEYIQENIPDNVLMDKGNRVVLHVNADGTQDVRTDGSTVYIPKKVLKSIIENYLKYVKEGLSEEHKKGMPSADDLLTRTENQKTYALGQKFGGTPATIGTPIKLGVPYKTLDKEGKDINQYAKDEDYIALNASASLEPSASVASAHKYYTEGDAFKNLKAEVRTDTVRGWVDRLAQDDVLNLGINKKLLDAAKMTDEAIAQYEASGASAEEVALYKARATEKLQQLMATSKQRTY